MGKYMGNSPFLSETDSLEFIPQADSSITTINTLFMSTTTPNTLKYTDSVGTLHTIEIPTMVVDSLNGLTGALSITTPNSTLTITNSSPNIELDINLANANTWSALQTFGNNISIGGAQFNIATLTTGNFLYYNGTNWINVIPITGTTLTEISGQLALNLANANTWTATQTFPTNSIPVSATELAVNTTLTLSTNTLSINLANANTWTALQTFGNNISIGGAQFNIATLTVGNFLYYNGTNWINQSLASGSGISISDYTISNSGVLSLNSLTGALDITTPNSTLNITNSSPNIELDINLANANTWTALQTFGVGLDVSASNNIIMNGIASTSTTTTENSGYIDLLGSYYNGTASVPYGFRLQSDITATTPAGNLNFNLNNNGTITTLMSISQSGSFITYNSENIIMNPVPSSANYNNSGYIDILGSYYNGTASTLEGFRIFTNILSTTPTGQLVFALNSNGTITNLVEISLKGDLSVKGNMGSLTFNTGNGIVSAPTVITVGASPFEYTNNTGYNIIVYIGGGVITAIAINGTTIASGLTSTTIHSYYLKPLNYITVTYTTAPSMWYINA